MRVKAKQNHATRNTLLTAFGLPIVIGLTFMFVALYVYPNHDKILIQLEVIITAITAIPCFIFLYKSDKQTKGDVNNS